MKRFLAALCAVCFVASSAFKIPEKEPAEDSINAESERVAAEAILVGLVLRDVAQNLAQDNTLHGEVDEYFFGELIGVIAKGVQGVVTGVATTITRVGDEVKGVVDAVRRWNSRLSIQDVHHKATKILTTVFDRAAAVYTFTDSKNGGDFVKYLCERVDTVGRRLIEQGAKVFDMYDITF